MTQHHFGKRAVSFILALIIMIGVVPFNVISAGTAVTPTPGTRVSDLSTLNNWKTLFGSGTNFNTANAGHVWTDKSVLTSAAELAYANELSDGTSKVALSGTANNFLVALSAISSSKSITGEANKPTDTMIVLDLSSSMYRGSAKETGAIKSMVDAVNETIANLQKLNVHNRVGVVIYYGGPDLNQATAPSYQSWLALDRYSHSSNKFLTYTTSSGKLNKVGVNSNVTNSAGAKVTATQRTVPDVSGTYVQQGLLAALETFKKADTTVPANASSQAGVKRTPVIILMSDGKPTAATNSYTNINSDAVMGSNREDIRSDAETDFLTQLTAAYTKEYVAAHYGETPLFYTLSLGNTISYDVMDPLNTLKLNSGTYTSKISGYWDKLVALKNTSSTITITAKVSKGQWNANTNNVDFKVKKVNLNNALFPANKAQQNYVNKAFVANTASDLKNVFNNIFTNISLQTHTYSTLVSGDADLGGYVSFVDKIGEYMTVTDVKGILIGNVWYSGKELSKNFVPGGGSLGNTSTPTDLGHELVHAVQQRLGITDVLVARSLLQNAYNYGQLSYNSSTGAFSNYVGWYADAQGKFLGFWHEGSTTQPAGAVYHMQSFLYLGTADASHGVRDSDLMYATVQHRTHIATGEETMTFAVPAALLPTVTYDIELNASGNPTSVKMGGATNPIRLVYEVALSDTINELTILDPTVVDPAYIAANTNSDGSVNFYTNQYETDNTVGYGKVNTYSYFRPSHSNENYYFLKNETIYTNTTGTKYISTSAPSAGGTYYRQTTVYKSVNGSISAENAYIKLSAEALATAKRNTADNSWYVSAGNVHADLARYTTAKAANVTSTLPNVETPFVDLHGHNVNDANHNFVIGYTLGNNGRVSILPTTGIKVTKSVSEVNTDTGANQTFEFTATNKANASDSSTYKTYLVSADKNVTESTITFASGKASFSLRAGESFYIIGMKAGDVISVTESETAYYVLSTINGANVKSVDLALVNRQISTAAFVNTARGKGNLTVAKEVSHSLGTGYAIPEDKAFNVTVTLSGLNLSGKTYEAKHSGNTTVAAVTIDANNSFSFTLRHDEQFEVYGLPEGITATVKETNIPAGFTAVYNENYGAGDGIVNITKGATELVEVLNTYKPDPVNVGTQIVVSGDKIFLNEDGSTVTDWEGKTFSATLQKWDGTKWGDLETVTATGTNRKFTFNFAGETYTEAGVYSYQVSEVIPDDKDGILYDRTYHTFSVTVGDSDMDGKLEILKVTSEHTGTDFTPSGGVWTVPSAFTNKKETSLPAVLEIKLQKELTNESLSTLVGLSGYSFGLFTDAAGTTALTVGNGIQKIDIALTDNVGEAAIDLIFDKAGNYSFYIKEIAGSTPSMKYSDQAIEVIVNVTSKEGRLYAEATYDASAVIKNNELVFTNVYTPTEASLDLDVRKILNGRELKADEFSFTLKSEDGTYTETVKNKADGDVSFTALKFTKVGTYVYYVNEVIPLDQNKLGGVTYDEKVHKVIVTVKDENGTLKASYVVEDTAENYVIFTNEYKAKSVDYLIEGTKILEGRTLLNDEFGFTLTACDENGAPISGAAVLEARNFTDGSFKFDKLTFDTAGTYYYLVAEKQENTASGVKYDTTEYIVRIVVKDNLKGALEIDSVNTIVKFARINSAAGVVFTNVYTPASTEGEIGGTKTYTTSISGTLEALDLSKNTFTFNLYHSDENWVQGEHIQSVHNDATGAFTFDKIKYDKVGTYYYIVTEQNGGQTLNGIVYDKTVYRVKITVTDNGKGALKASILIANTNNVQQDSISFSNEYVITDNAEAEFKGQKFLHGLTLANEQFSFVLIDTTENKSNTTPLETVKNKADGSFSFAPITYTKPGTYTYVVKEVNGGQTIDGIKYDNTVYEINVEVKDNGTGKLIATVSGVESLTFTNTYTPAATSATLGGNKTYTTSVSGTTQNLDLSKVSFTFNLYHSDSSWAQGEHIQGVQSDASGKFSFDKLNFDKVGEYFYLVKEHNGGQTINGTVYDSAVYRVKIVVTDDGKGALSASVALTDASGNAVTAIAFANTYVITDNTEAVFNGKKFLHGKALEAGKYEFVLKDEGGNVIETVKNAADGTFSFKAIKYTKAGTYKYTVSEVKGSLGGITYDTTVYNITVEVKDNGSGKLIATVSGAESITFTNTYNVSPVSTKLGGTKKFYTVIDGINKDLDLSKTVFTFSLYNSDASWTLGEHIQSVENDAAGAFSFDELKFSKAGTYYYVVQERNGGRTVNGIAHDATVYRIKVTVTDNGDGTLTATTAIADSSNAAKSQIVFTNIYTATESGEVVFDGSKILHGKALEAGKYEFVLKDEGGNVIETVKNKADGTFSFKAIKYTKAGTYKYTVSEVKGSLGGITYDTTVYEVTVTVTDNGVGKLITAVQNANNIVFTNNYTTESTKASFGGIKTLVGRDLKAGEFTFVLLDQNGEVIESVKNAANGTFSFSEITYTAAGTYTYTVAEVIGFAGGIKYDDAKYTVEVTVTDDGNGKLKAEVSGANGIKFTNTYSTSETEVSFSGHKDLVGRNLKNDEFSFILKDENGNEIETVKNHSDGTFSFKAIKYTKAGTYKYTVSEVKGDLPGITYDTTEYSITVEVKDNGSGKLVATVTGADSIFFKNTYNASTTEIHLSGLKNLVGRTLKAGEFSFVLKDSNGNDIEIVQNKADGLFEFSALKFSAPGTYTYTVSEVAGSLGGVTYATNSYTVTVTVVDDTTLGQLVATASDNASAIVFTNVYETKSTKAAISGKKNLIGRNLSAGEFSFVLKDANGNVIETVSNKADGSFAFTAIEYAKAGTYTYTVSEVAGALGGITYDGTIHTVTVIVSDNGQGQLTATVQNPGNVVFNNVYQTRPGSAKFNGTKIFEGALLKEGEFSFTLTETTRGSVLLETVTNSANGNFSFSEINYSNPGVYTYEIRETAGDRSNVDYDSTVHVITVTVTDNGDGTLNVNVSNNANAIIFKNKYNVTPALLPISGVKTIDGRTLNANEFSFVLKDADGNELERVKNDENGKWSFTDIELGEVGTYTFTVSEVKGSLGGVTYDETVYEITATVTDDGFGKLSAAATVNKIIGKSTTAVTLADLAFNNKYETTDTNAVIKGQKSLYGRDLISGEFIFVLTDENGNRIDSASNDANGNFEFDPIDYTAPGVYTYYVSEYNSGDSSIVYDNTVYTVTVIVSDNGQGALTTTVVSSENIHFVNRYSARPAEVRFSATKFLEGRDLTKGEFSFILSDGYGNVIQTVKNKEDGSITFAWLVFPQEGTFVYRIREIIGNDENVIYDETVYEITVVVYDDMTGDLIAEVIGGDNLIFTNVYEAPEETTEIPEETTKVPEETTEVPEVTTGPEVTTEVPEVTTGPEVTTEVPEVTTGPEVTTEVPEVTTEPEVTTDPSETTEPDSPTTGDGSKVTIWLGAIFVAFCATAGALFSKKRNSVEE